MNRGYLLACLMFPLLCNAEVTTYSDDPLLDARMKVEEYRLRYTEKNPRMIFAEAKLAKIEKTFHETPAEYEAHLQKRLQEAEAEKAELELRYSAKHPKMICENAFVSLLQAELVRAKQTSTQGNQP